MIRALLVALFVLALPTYALADIPAPTNTSAASVRNALHKVEGAPIAFRTCDATTTGARRTRCYAAVYWQLDKPVEIVMYGFERWCRVPNSIYTGLTLQVRIENVHRKPNLGHVNSATSSWKAFNRAIAASTCPAAIT